MSSLREQLAAMPDTMRARAAGAGPMAWGRDDCLLCYADDLSRILGFDIADGFRGRYRTRIGAYRLLRKKGFSSIAEAVTSQARSFGWRRISPGKAQAGDIGVVTVGGAQSCAMLSRSGFWIARSEKGYAALAHCFVVVAFCPVADIKRITGLPPVAA